MPNDELTWWASTNSRTWTLPNSESPGITDISGNCLVEAVPPPEPINRLSILTNRCRVCGEPICGSMEYCWPHAGQIQDFNQNQVPFGPLLTSVYAETQRRHERECVACTTAGGTYTREDVACTCILCGAPACSTLLCCNYCFEHQTRRAGWSYHQILLGWRRHLQQCTICREETPITLPDEEEDGEIGFEGDDPQMSLEKPLITTAFGLHNYTQRIVIPSKSIGQQLQTQLPMLWREYAKGVKLGAASFKLANPNPKEIALFKTKGIYTKESIVRVRREACSLLKTRHTRQIHYHKFPPYSEHPTYRSINYIGMELEGGWRAPKVKIYHDGSVDCDLAGGGHVGESRTVPMPPYDFNWDDNFFGFYPDETNITCGLHVHVSFPSSGVYATFVDKAFFDWFLEGLLVWGKTHGIKSKQFYNRLAGKNWYTRRAYKAEEQLTDDCSGEERYCAINYCYRKHGTIEIRVLPMFQSKEIAKKAVTEVVRLIDLWGTHFAPRPRKPAIFDNTVAQ